MASSSYCEMSVALRNGTTIVWTGEDGESPFFQIPSNAKKIVSSIDSIDDLKAFILKCASVYEDYEFACGIYQQRCAEFDAALCKIDNLSEISSIKVSWGEFDPSDCLPPQVGCEGESLEFDFATQKCKTKRTAEKWFISEMVEIYGDMFDEEDFY